VCRRHEQPLAGRKVIEPAILRTSGAVIREVDLSRHASLGRETASSGTAGSRATNSTFHSKEYLRRAEKDLARVLRKYRGGMNLAPKHARVDAATLHRKMERHGLRREDYRHRGNADPDALAQ